ncbi:hypothetical protein EMGBS15_05660 [Filimonas sp.]|nr:hypothetical protein EMGBS15_05660 [Filimonas sp.]
MIKIKNADCKKINHFVGRGRYARQKSSKQTFLASIFQIFTQ